MWQRARLIWLVILGQRRYFMLNVLRTIDNAIASIRQVLVMYDYRTAVNKKKTPIGDYSDKGLYTAGQKD